MTTQLLYPEPPQSPGTWLGVLGGGQLGRMFCMAAQSLGYKVCVLDPGSDSPAGVVADRHIQADYIDPVALQELARVCRSVTTEFENVPAQALTYLEQHCVVSPRARSVEIAQHRIREKVFIEGCGLAVAPFAVIEAESDIVKVADNLFPAILKLAQLGYDGKGQVTVSSKSQLPAAFAQLGSKACVLERRMVLQQEISVVVGRDFARNTLVFPVSSNVHVDGILYTSQAPAQMHHGDHAALLANAAQIASHLANSLDYVGVLCVEMFLVDGKLLVNEIAPRPHNSGHFTIDACVTSQFEQQARIMAGLPMGSTKQLAASFMINILGDSWFDKEGVVHEPNWNSVLKHDQAKLHLYGKSEPRRGRKMGHITVVADTVAQSFNVAQKIISELDLPQRGAPQ